ncbi:FadR/GntR family transcriptional regulator [Nocardia carnea]|uniref:FadR/GntR family transcriptional regulator n=1 Tax=Nocardia carnea TaxID=37328 RepID=UPI002454E31A|nr:FCD domain-containing protein [Nocardia carnea]
MSTLTDVETGSGRERAFPLGDGAVRTPKVAEQIAQRLRGRIVRGELEPGTMLEPEKQLLDEFGVSRPTVREALRILENEGLIVVLTGARGGARVQTPDLTVAARQIGYFLQIHGTTLEDLLDARAEFEPVCVRLLAERHTAKSLRELEYRLDRLREVLEAGLESEDAFVAWVGLTREFHELIADHCGNNTLAAMARAVGELQDAHRRRSLRSVNYRPSSPEVGPALIADYAELLELVRAGRGHDAQEHWRGHLLRSADVTYRSQDRTDVVDLVD